MTTAETKNLEAALEAKRAELIRTIRGRAAELILERSDAELIDQIQAMADRDEVAIILSRFSSTLENVQRSLQAIAEGSYGVCAMCEEPIAVKRLQAIPWATYCVRCQEQFEAARKSMGKTGTPDRQLEYMA